MSCAAGGGGGLRVLDLAPAPRFPLPYAARFPSVRIGIASDLLTPEETRAAQDLTFTLVDRADDPGLPWFVAVDDVVASQASVVELVGRAESAASVGDHVLRVCASLLDHLPAEEAIAQGLVVESLAYSALLAGPDFGRWRGASRRRAPRPRRRTRVRVERSGATLRITLDHPERRNAFSRLLRHELLDALRVAALDPSIRVIELRGDGPTFSSGGDLDEFGTAGDPVTAHLTRLDHSAGLAVWSLADKVRPSLHGPCFGAGVEVPAFASRVVAAPDTTFCLPELRFGLIPGAGGSVSVTRRIGRWRTAYLLMSGHPIDVQPACAWGLIDDIA